MNQQRHLLRAAIESTDAYLAVEKHAVESGFATKSMLQDFSIHMSNTYDILKQLGILDQHEAYMQTHVDTMIELNSKGNDAMPFTDKAYYSIEESKFTSKAALLNFGAYLKEEKLSDEDIQKIVDDLTWEDVVDLYSDNELEYEPEEDEEDEEDEDEDDEDEDEEEKLKEEVLDEKLSVQARLKKRQAFARMKGKRNVARNMKLRRASTTNVLKKRATVAARRAIYKRFLRGRDKATLSAAEKDRIETQVRNMKYLQQTIAVKMLPRMREIEQKRLSSKRGAKTIRPSKAPKLKVKR